MMSDKKPTAFADCATPEDCQCLELGAQVKRGACAVLLLREGLEALGIPIVGSVVAGGRVISDPIGQGYLINSRMGVVSRVTFTDLAEVQQLVGGPIEVAYQWGNGLMVGREEEGPQFHDVINHPPTMPLEQLRARVRFWRARG